MVDHNYDWKQSLWSGSGPRGPLRGTQVLLSYAQGYLNKQNSSKRQRYESCIPKAECYILIPSSLYNTSFDAYHVALCCLDDDAEK